MTKSLKNKIKRILAWILICSLVFDANVMASIHNATSSNATKTENVGNFASSSDSDFVEEFDEDEEDEDAIDTNDYAEEPEEDIDENINEINEEIEDDEMFTPSDAEESEEIADESEDEELENESDEVEEASPSECEEDIEEEIASPSDVESIDEVLENEDEINEASPSEAAFAMPPLSAPLFGANYGEYEPAWDGDFSFQHNFTEVVYPFADWPKPTGHSDLVSFAGYVRNAYAVYTAEFVYKNSGGNRYTIGCNTYQFGWKEFIDNIAPEPGVLKADRTKIVEGVYRGGYI